VEEITSPITLPLNFFWRGRTRSGLNSFTHDYCFDQRVGEGDLILTADDWMASPGITGRLKQAIHTLN
jgi:hypothetical protein